jgi:hypothetical protein
MADEIVGWNADDADLADKGGLLTYDLLCCV